MLVVRSGQVCRLLQDVTFVPDDIIISFSDLPYRPEMKAADAATRNGVDGQADCFQGHESQLDFSDISLLNRETFWLLKD